MNRSRNLSRRARRLAAIAVALAALVAGAASAQSPARLAVVEVERLLTESQAGKQALESIQAMGQEKEAAIQAKEAEVADLRKRLSEGQLSLSQERQEELNDALQRELINLNRMRDDAARDLKRVRDEAFERIERTVIPLIEEVARAQGYTMVFNKYQSGLLFAVDEIDVTDTVIQRFDAAQPSGE